MASKETRPAGYRQRGLVEDSGSGSPGLPSNEGSRLLRNPTAQTISPAPQSVEEALAVFNDLHRASELFFSQAQRLIPCQIASSYYVDQSSDEVTTVLFGSSLAVSQELGCTFPLSGSWIEQHCQSEVPIVESIKDGRHSSSIPPNHLQAGIKSQLTVPLINHGRLSGVITLHSQSPGAFNDKVVTKVSELGCRLASSVESAALSLRGSRQEKFAQALHKASTALTSNVDIEQALETVCRECCSALESTYAVVHEAQGYDLVHRAAWPAEAMQVYRNGSHLSLDGHFTEASTKVVQTKLPEVLNELQVQARKTSEDGASEVNNRSATMCVPLVAREQVIGVLELGHVETGRKFTRFSVNMVEAFASNMAIALENARLTEHLATSVTAQKQNEEALRYSESQHSALLAAIPDAMFRISKDGTYLGYIAPESFQLLVSPKEFLGKNLESVVPNQVARLSMESIAEALSTHQVQTFEYQLAIDEQARDYEARIVANGPEEVLAIIRDVTERKSLEAQFLQSQKMESLGRLAGGIAHDFNNLLGGIMGYASLLKSKLDPSTDAHEFASIIEKATQRGAQLTQQLLTAARRSRFDSHPTNINEVAEEVVQILSRTLPRGIIAVSQLQPDLPSVLGDHSQLHQVLMNLCINAADAMPNGGTLTLSSNKVFLDEAFCRQHLSLEPGQHIELTITDTGMGISESDLPKIFDPFFTTKEPGKGTGLGLAVVYAIVKNHGGMIEVNSVMGEGSSFLVYLPVHEEKQD